MKIKNKKLKIVIQKGVAGLILTAMQVVNVPWVVAQELAVGTGKVVTPTLHQSYLESEASSLAPSMSDGAGQAPISTLLPKPTLGPEDQVAESARVRLPLKIANLAKKNYQMWEKITLAVMDLEGRPAKIKVVGPEGEEGEVGVTEERTTDTLVYTIYSRAAFRPGKYRLVVDDGYGHETEQDFLWGVLALNPDRSIYVPGEMGKLDFAVLNDKGEMVCDANLKLQVTSNNSQINDELSTEKGGIKVNEECKVKGFTEKPDYEATYTFQEKGVYRLTLTAQTESGEYAIEDQVEVRDLGQIPFRIKRKSATRIYPPETYQMDIEVEARNKFSGVVAELVPDSFVISTGTGNAAVISYDRVTEAQNVLGARGAWVPDLSQPVLGAATVSQGFGVEESDPLMSKKYQDFGVVAHDGIDWAVPSGTEIHAVDDGVVARARENYDYGTTVVIEHNWGKSYYGHLSVLRVKEGQSITKGDLIALSGNTGLSTGPHLHFGIKPSINDATNGYFGKIDPGIFLGMKQSSVDQTSADMGYKQVEWNLDLKAGEKVNIGYKYVVPSISPQFYLMGPLEFKSQATSNKSQFNTIFREARQWQIAADAVSNGGTITYGNSPAAGTGSVNFRTYTETVTLGSETNTVEDGTGNIRFVKVVAAPTREEKMMVQMDQNGRLDVKTCTSGCDAAGDWTLRGTYATALTPGNTARGRGFDVAYEQFSGDAIVGFTDDDTTGEVYYCIWDGSSWTPSPACGATFVPDQTNDVDLVSAAGLPVWVRLVPRGERLTGYRNDEMFLGVSTASNDLSLHHWTGSEWNQGLNPTDLLNNNSVEGFDIAWEETTGEALTAYAGSGTKLAYRTYTAADGWGQEQSGGEIIGKKNIEGIRAANDPRSDDISVVAISLPPTTGVEGWIWNGTTIATGGTADVSVETNVGPHPATAWTRFSQRALYLWTDANALTSDMQCYTSGGGFASLVSDIGSGDINNSDDVDDTALVGSPNSDRMLFTRHDIVDDLIGLTYSDTTGCADGDWGKLDTENANDELNVAVEGQSGNTLATAHWPAYTPYSPWGLNWRFFDDETVNDPSTGLNGAAENTTPTSVDQEEFIRLRMNMAERSGQGQTDTRKKLQYTSGCNPNTSETACTWSDVGDTSETTATWRYATSAESCSACTDGNTSTTSRLTGTDEASPSVFYVSDKDAAADTDFDHTALKVREIDFPLKAEDVALSTTYYFRLYEPRISSNGQDSQVFREQDNDGNNDCATATCTYPSLTISAAAGPTNDQLLRHGNWFSSGVEQPFTF